MVYWASPAFVVSDINGDYFCLGAGKSYPFDDNQLKDTEVIGNKIDNFNLLKGKK